MTDLDMTSRFGDANSKHAQALANMARAEQGDLRWEAMCSVTSLPPELGYSSPSSGYTMYTL